MATLDFLKTALRQKSLATTVFSQSMTQPLSDSQYSAGFEVLIQGSEWVTYEDFIIPQLSLLLGPMLNTRRSLSVLEIGPGPESVLEYLPMSLRMRIKKYAAFEPNELFAAQLEQRLCSPVSTQPALPCLETRADIRRAMFGSDTATHAGINKSGDVEKYDIVLFCHSMYGIKPKQRSIEMALKLLPEQRDNGLVVVFHRGENLGFDGLACHRTSFYPDGVVSVADDDNVLDQFSSFITGYVIHDTDTDTDKAIRTEWRKLCRFLGRREDTHPKQLLFNSPTVMIAFTKHASALLELTSKVPVAPGDQVVKNWEARLRCPTSTVKPRGIRQVQYCVQWALDHGFSLTVLGGGHSGQCMWSNVVSVDMGAFDQVHVIPRPEKCGAHDSESCPLVVVEAGCKSGNIIRETMAAGLTIPLGARPSVGAGLWLQGGIGHLARLHGLACDAIVGAVIVNVSSSQIVCVGLVPSQYRPAGAVLVDFETDQMWAMKGAGTNFGIVISITFKAHAAPRYSIRNWVVSLDNDIEARRNLSLFEDSIASKLPRTCSADLFLYWKEEQLHFGVTMFESSTTALASGDLTPALSPNIALMSTVLGMERSSKIVDGIGIFETEMYMSELHGGHGGGKTFSFKRCVFLKHIGAADVAAILIAALHTRPSPMCYLHLLQGGGAVQDVAADATAFGCRDWDFACVVTGIWSRDDDDDDDDDDGTEAAQVVVRWVYKVVEDLLPLSRGVYGADLGPDPRDAALAAQAFGPNRSRLARLKHSLDPRNVLAYACPIIKPNKFPKTIILVTGESCAGKDYCADIWCSSLSVGSDGSLRARTLSISDAIKREFAAAMGVDLKRLVRGRTYKEEHRSELSKYLQGKMQERPQLLEEQFMQVLDKGAGLDVLFITGMREEAPLASYSHLVPDSRLLEVRVEAKEEMRRLRRGEHSGVGNTKDSKDDKYRNERPSLVFTNDTTGVEGAEIFFEQYLRPFFDSDLQRLADMVPLVPNFPQPGVHFRHVLEIPQRPSGLSLSTSLLQHHFTGDWDTVDAIVSCETGGYVFASALAARLAMPLALVREAGKLPPPTISVSKSPSHISSYTPGGLKEKNIEIGRDVVGKGASVVVIDDVLATGKTLCAVLQLLGKAGVGAEDVVMMVVAEFPVHRGRELLRKHGFGGVRVQSLLVFGGA